MISCAYLRVSSKGQDYASQRAAIERVATARGDSIADWYNEKRSGKTIARPELQRLRDNVRAGKVRRLYVFRLDRLGRSGIRDILGVIDELKAANCELVSVADGFDLNGPAAEVVVAVIAWAAKVERMAINERIASARERMAAEGKSWGRPPRLNDADRQKVIALSEAGNSVREIAAAIRCPKTTVQRVLAYQKHGAKIAQKSASEMPPHPVA